MGLIPLALGENINNFAEGIERREDLNQLNQEQETN